MKKISFTLVLFLISLIGNAQIVNIPDVNFKNALLNYQPAIDTNSDGQIQVSEALVITNLNLQFSQYGITDLTGISSFTNLQSLNCNSLDQLTTLNLSGLTNLQTLNCSFCYNITTLNLTGLINLQTLDCSECNLLTTLNLTGLTNLQTLNCLSCGIAALNVTGLTNLQVLNCANCYQLTSLDLSSLSNLQTLNCSHSNNLAYLNVSNLTYLTYLNCNGCFITTLITTGANNITYLDCSHNGLTSLMVSNMLNLQHLDCSSQNAYGNNNFNNINLIGLNNLTYLNCSSNNLTSLDVSNLINLTYLNCNYNQILSLNLSNLTNLTFLSCGGNLLSILNVTPLVNLTSLDCHSNQLSILNIDSLINLHNIDCGQNNISNLNLSNQSNLTLLACAGNQLTTLNISTLHNLTDLICSSNHLTAMDFSNFSHLTNIGVGGNLFSTLDFSNTGLDSNNNNSFLLGFESSPNLISLNLKNGIRYDDIDFDSCPNLQYICCDEQNIDDVQHFIQQSFNPPQNVQINSYCSFVPGGINNTIAGRVTLDINNNGCDSNDLHPNNIRIGIDDGTLSGATFTNNGGNYSFYTQTGNFVLTPQFQNPYFTVSPLSATVNSPTLDGLTQTRDFCIIPNGIHNDVEISIEPMDDARPGFDANYKLIYTNKGNQTLSGNINLTFNDAIIDFVSANPAIDSQSINNLSWNYSNLYPFETRTINLTLNVNAPTETPPVNINDILAFTAVINPVLGDDTAIDNSFNFNQIVGGSFDPNDKICLEGATINPARIGDYLHYIIHFQNSGTAPAENIVVKDIIDTTKFDISTLQLTSSSHPQVTKISGDKAEFYFEGINLPAEQDNEPASHGYIAFKIKTKSNLVVGNTVSNTANIYFDYNFPIVTNTATSTFYALGSKEFENKTVTVFPNPVKNSLTISAKDTITSIQLLDVQGRLIETKLNSSNEVKLDLAERNSGIYFVKIITENGVKIEKVIKE